jgi:hypothetical protein
LAPGSFTSFRAASTASRFKLALTISLLVTVVQ